MTNGIYTLANDVVFDQLVALLNSIEVHLGKDFPVSVIPYDNNLDKVKTEIYKRQNVQLFDNQNILERWQDFATRVWENNSTALKTWQEKGEIGIHRFGTHARFCGFDEESPFDNFIYCDADIIVLNSLDFIFEKLKEQDFIVYDYQYKDPSHVYNVNSSKLFEVFSENRIKSEIFCSGFYASKKGLFSEEFRNNIIEKIKNEDGEIIYPWAPDQTILNYMTMVSDIRKYNFALNLPPEERTGNSVTSSHFKYQDDVLYDKGVRLTYLHYIGVSSKVFTKVCAGENYIFPYRDIFLHYRYLHEPEKKPKFEGRPKVFNPPPTLIEKIFKKLGFNFKSE